MEQPENIQPKKGYWQKPNNWIRIFTLLAVLTYTAVQIQQTVLISSNNIVSQRAFVSVAFSGQFVSVNMAGTPTSLNLLASLTNSGNTATKDMKLLVRCVPSSEELQEPWVLIHQGLQPSVVPIVIGPHASSTTACSFPMSDIYGMQNGDTFGYLLVDVSYLDRLDNTQHITQFDNELQQVHVLPAPLSVGTETGNPSTPNIQYVLIPVGKHNCADEECPADDE